MEGKWTLDAMSMRKDLYGWCGQIFVPQQTARRFPQSPGKEDDYGIICIPPLEENTDAMIYI